MITVWLHKCLLGKGTWVEQHLSMESEPADWIGLDFSQFQQYPIVIKKIYWYLKEKKNSIVKWQCRWVAHCPIMHVAWRAMRDAFALLDEKHWN